MIYGHALVVQQLEAQLPPVALLSGPASVGKTTLALHLAEHHGVLPVDRRHIETLTVEESRSLKAFAALAPMGASKLAIVHLDNSSAVALNALLKLLEEPPASCRFLLLASRPTLATIESRAVVHRLGLLSEEDLMQVLTQRLGMSDSAAAAACRSSLGTVESAQEMELLTVHRSPVLSVLKAVSDGDADQLTLALSDWSDGPQRLLRAWCIERLTGRWRVFTEHETFGLQAEEARQILRGLARSGRPKLVARASLERVLLAHT